MNLDPIIQSEVSQKEKREEKRKQYCILMHIYGIQKDGNDELIQRTDLQIQWEKERVGQIERSTE